MVNVVVKSQKTILHMTISPISDLDEICSPTVFIHGIPWKVKVSKDEDENSLAIYLQCAKDDDSSFWTIPACATIALMPFSEEKHTLVHHITPYVFSPSRLSFGYYSIIKWDNLLKDESQYMQNDTIQLKIEITAEDPNCVDRATAKFETIDKSCDCGSHATYRLTVTNVKNLMAVRAPQFTVRGLPWYLTVYKCQKSTLGVLLDAKKRPNEVSCKITMSVKILSSYDDVDPIQMSDTDTVHWPGTLDIESLISWDELLKPENGFVNNDAITLEVEIKADKPVGDVPNVDPVNVAKRRRFECSICLEGLENQDVSATECGHMFCTACITKAVKDRRVCPMCKTAIQLNKLRRLY